MSLLMYAPLQETVPLPEMYDFDFPGLDFRTLSEAPPAEALEPSLLEPSSLEPSAGDLWKELSTDSRPPSSPEPPIVMDFMDDNEVIVKQEIEDDVFEWGAALLDSKQLRNDCMWSSESAEVPVAVKSVGGVAAAAAAAAGDAAAALSAAVVKEVATVSAVKCESSVVPVKCEPEDTVVAVSCGPVVTTVAGAGANTLRTGARAQTSLLNKSEVSLLKTNNRSLLISSRTGVVSANSTPVPSSPVKNNVVPERSERVKPSVMWGPWASSSSQATATCFQQTSLGSDGDSPRPYTPPSQSESEEDDDHPRFRHSFDMVLGLGSELFDNVDSSSSEVSGSSLDAVSVFCDTVNCDLDLDDEAYVASLAEAAELMCRPSVTYHASDTPTRAKSNSRKSESASRREEIESSRHAFMSDHSYHLSKGSVKTEHLGVQTPSDSEEEIDVVSVGDKHCARTSAASATALPTNPSARDRQQLQLTVASAITAKHHGGGGGRGGRVSGVGPGRGRIPVRITLGDRTVGVRSVAQATVVDPAYDVEGGAASSEEQQAGPARGGPGRKRGGSAGAGRGGAARRPRVQYQHRLQHHAPRGRGRRPRGAAGGDDSEPDPTEKRSLHNDMERQRRIDLRNLVDDLRKLVPELKDNKRAAKVMILREAAKYCRHLRDEGRALVAESAALRRQQDRMMARCSALRRDLAASRRELLGNRH